MRMNNELCAPQMGIRWIGTWTLYGLALVGALGCSNETATPVVGTGHVVESVTAADIVEKVTVSLPFEAEVVNGQPKELYLRGEDNLLGRITVEETSVGEWRIAAPQGLAFTQHDVIEVAVPYLDMVKLSIDGDRVTLKDKPWDFWRDAGVDGG